MPEDTTSWVKRKHPDYETWATDEARMLATFHARRRDLAPFLVPHRHEQDPKNPKNPENLPRADLGFGVSLNESYLSEIFGHIRGASAQHDWGSLGGGDGPIEGAPADGTTARKLWEDATRQNLSWRNFFGRSVLEAMLSTPGSVIVCDTPPGRQDSESDDANRRPYVQNVPLSDVWDVGRSPTGIRWVKMLEQRDRRAFNAGENEISENVIVYRLDDTGDTLVRRWDLDGEPMGEEINMGPIVDRDGQPALPIVLNTFGSHPDVPWIGSGLLVGLDDIVIDMFNTVSEIREGYRAAIMALLVYKGEDFDEVADTLEKGGRAVDLGGGENASLERLAPESTEVDAGLSQMEMQLKAWARSAKRKASDFEETAQPRTGVSLQAEFQIDLVPLLREVVEHFDNVESSVMHRLAQLDDENQRPESLQEIGVTRNRDFDPEDEASRIARLVSEFSPLMGVVPAEAKSQIVVRWLEANGVNDLAQEVETAGGETVSLREMVESRAEELAEFSERQMRQRASLTGPLVRETEDDAA